MITTTKQTLTRAPLPERGDHLANERFGYGHGHVHETRSPFPSVALAFFIALTRSRLSLSSRDPGGGAAADGLVDDALGA